MNVIITLDKSNEASVLRTAVGSVPVLNAWKCKFCLFMFSTLLQSQSHSIHYVRSPCLRLYVYTRVSLKNLSLLSLGVSRRDAEETQH